ncbi:Crp/Fnr family transcriptional regulator [Cohnella sp. CFH 77786]|uniref:Crp/Fnr family transcriptional regulator n=1 Tax=Cohnella sp. CFH 77786 TaxID=2662265 RepID=UPI001C610AD4|nr:cyclic nucleotide-binding domain-containing protein [Cohnella sp. CFH 77786]
MAMKKLSDPAALSRWVNQYGLEDILSEKARERMELFSYGKGEPVCQAGEDLAYLMLLVSGKLKLSRLLPNGRSILIRFYRPLSMIGDLELLNGQPANCSVESVGTTIVIAIPADVMRETALEDPRFLRFVIRHLSNKLMTMSNASTLNMLYPLENRFASYLVSITGSGSGGEEADEIRTPKLTEVAELLGTSYRHLNRIITKLASEGLLERKRGKILVHDLQQLHRLAEGNSYH